MRLKIQRSYQSLVISLLSAVLIFVCASLRHKGFGSVGVFVNLLDDGAFLGIAAIGMTFVILSGGIDLSVGAVIGLTSILSAILIERLHWHPAAAALAVILLGAALGAVMGILIAFFELAPFLVTLAGLFFARGLALTLSLDSIPLTHAWVSALTQTRLMIPGTNVGLPMMSLVFLFIVAVGSFVAAMTRFGRNVYAVGGSEMSAKLMGLPVKKTLVTVYALSGALAALAGVVYSVYTQSGNSTAATGLELDAIAAVVIGGTLLTGGTGYVVGTLIGTLILGMIQTIITFEANLNSWWTRIVIAALLLIFVMLQRGLSALSTRKKASRFAGTVTGSGATAALLCFIFIPFLIPFSARALNCPDGYRAGKKIAHGLYQLTGTEIQPGQKTFDIPELPDPAPPFVTAKGEIEIYGSARYFIRFHNWNEFEKGGCYEVVPFNIVGPTRVPYRGQYTHPWDVRKYQIDKSGAPSREVLLGGSMTAHDGQSEPIWPDDNLNRRIYFFRPNEFADWVRDSLPIVGDIATGWLGHSYGGNLIQENARALNVIDTDRPGQIAFFYEKVSDARGNSPFKTEIFASKMSSPDTVVPGSEVKIMDVHEPAWPSTVRTVGGFLVEGPRPIQVRIQGRNGGRKYFIIGFSSGDFSTDSYFLNFMWSKKLFGPYKAALTRDGKDLLDLGQDLKRRYGLSWLGRPSFYHKPDGSYGMLFHAVVKDVLPDNDYTHWPTKYQLWEFHRSLFKVPVEFYLNRKGEAKIRLVLDDTK